MAISDDEWNKRRLKKLEEDQVNRQKIETTKISDKRRDYIFSNEDYKRGLDKEREYHLKHKASLFRLYGNRCANCGDDENGLEVDHFIFSKNEGGCFQMQHVEGYFVNNALPLCEKCNRSKGDQSYRDFFSLDKLAKILVKNLEMTKRLNKIKAKSKKVV
jgi:5-methylcytosine-specific restriction endonuclease McrA